MARPTEQSAAEPVRTRGPWLPTLVVLVLSLGATFAAWTASRKAQDRRDQSRVARFMGRTGQSLQNRLGRYEDLARGARGFFAGETFHQSIGQWRTYVASLNLRERHPGLSSLAFVAPVPDSSLSAFLSARPQLRGRYHLPAADPAPLLPSGPGREHLIIELCEPEEASDRTLGLDVGASRAQRAAAERAVETGEPELSSLVYGTHAEGRQEAVVLFVPIFNGQQTPATPAARRAALRGWVSASVLLRPLLDGLIRGDDPGLSFALAVPSAEAGSQMLYTAPDWPAGHPPDTVRRLEFAGQVLQLQYAVKPGFYQAEGRTQSLLFLVAGLAISLSLGGMVWSLAGTRNRAETLARGMTTSLHEAIQRNRSHVAYTPLAVIETDPHFHIREWNSTAESIFGFTREQALGQDPRMIIPDEQHGEELARRKALLASPGGLRLSTENLTRTGQKIICDWYNTALRDEHGGLLGVMYLADDVTERRRSEGALRQAQKLESLGVLAGGIAHDFNNLLTAILGNTEVALDLAKNDPTMRHALQRIESTSQRGSDLARQLLAYAGKAHFEIRPLDLNAIILEMGDLLSVSISKKVTLRQDLEPGLPPVEADSAQFQQIVMNLVINASEAIGENPGSVTIRTRAVTYSKTELAARFPGQMLEPGPSVLMEVADDGCGMDAETIGRIFDPFFTTKFTGRGLGLSAMLGIVRGHRAGIHVESAPGKGTTFALLFPASAATVIVPAADPEPSKPMAGTILVVDDEPVIRELARSALESSGFEVVEARDGLEAVERVRSGAPKVDLVLMDMTMPRMGGAEAFRRIRELRPNLPVLLTSGYTQKESLLSLADSPPDGFLQKPFRIRELVSRVRDILRNRTDKTNTE